jgi:hypothetical protein
LQAQIIRFPVERCRLRSTVDIAAFMFAPMFFCLTMATMLMIPVTCERNHRRATIKRMTERSAQGCRQSVLADRLRSVT